MRDVANLPPIAAWRHRGVRAGFEVLFLDRSHDGYRLEGHATAVEDGEAWATRYTIAVDSAWRTRTAVIDGRSSTGSCTLTLESDAAAAWRVDGAARPDLAGCLDVDLEASVFTNALPVRRLGLTVGDGVDARAVWVRAIDVTVEPLDQRYVRAADDGRLQRYDYVAPELEFEAQLVYDEFGLIVDYPGMAVRVL